MIPTSARPTSSRPISSRPIPSRPRLVLAAAAIAATTALVLAGCSSDGGTATVGKAPKTLSGNVSLWHFFTDREAKVIQKAVDGFEKENPKVKVEVHTGQDDTKLQQVISSGGNVDVALSYASDIVGNFCTTGAFIDLGPYISRDNVDLDDFPDSVRSYTQFDGKRCALPLLADVPALYTNTAMLSAAGITEAPKTLDELSTDALALTTYNDDGSIKTLGFNPTLGFYENSPGNFSASVGAKWLKSNGKADVADSSWPEVMKWQKALVDKIGWDKLKAFTAGLGQEFSASNAFQTGQVAMQFDGEWRTAFIADQTPDLAYETSPFPAAADHSELYGSGVISGNVVGIGKGSKSPELAWALMKYLTTKTSVVVDLANGLKNVPTTTSALDSPDLVVSKQFKTFIDIAKNDKTIARPSSPLGAGYGQPLTDFWTKWQAGSGDGLDSGLKTVAKQMDNSLALVEGP